MNYSEQLHIREAVNTLINQYQQYNLAKTEEEKDRIGDAMKYKDPIIWMMYKHEAYIHTDHAIQTLKDLKEHSIDHGGICSRRFTFIHTWAKEKYAQDILDDTVFKPGISIVDFYNSTIMQTLVNDPSCMEAWQNHEFYTHNGKVAKWENYK